MNNHGSGNISLVKSRILTSEHKSFPLSRANRKTYDIVYAMTTTLLIIGIVALVFLIFSALLDGLFDVFDIDVFDGLFGPASIATFFLVFGFGGSWMSGFTGIPGGIVLVIAAMLGALVFIPIGFLTRYLARSESGIVSSSNLVGNTGNVLTDIRVGAYGQVRMNHSGHLMTLTATADEEITSPTVVRVVSVTPPNIVHVERVVPVQAETVVNEEKPLN